MFLSAMRFVRMNMGSRLDNGFIEQAQYRLAVMAIGRGGSYRHDQPFVINHR